MHNKANEPVTLLTQARQADGVARLKLLSDLYDEIRRIAGVLLASSPGSKTLQPTALANEAVVKLLEALPHWQSTGQEDFLSLISVIMHNVLVDRYRRRKAAKRGGGFSQVELHDGLAASSDESYASALDIHHALVQLRIVDPRASAVTSFKLLGHTTIEIAEELAISVATTESDWRFARAWLRRELRGYWIPDYEMEP